MGHAPIANNTDLAEIRILLKERGIKRVFDISEWDEGGNWMAWRLNDIPECLLQQVNTLKTELKDVVPVHKFVEDSWGWGSSGIYSSAKGYAALQPQREISHPSSF